jgi:predicted lipoprotein with Yx(FWY)xxD motif
MKRMLMVGLTTALGIFSACADEPEADVALEGTAVEEPVAEPAVVPVGPQAGAVLEVDTLQGVGPYLTDQSGRALYLLEGGAPGEITCYDACAGVWPPFLAPQGTPTAGAPPVQAGLIGTIQRRDGATQVTYAGHPLYYYTKDQGPGQATGQDVTDQWGEWYLVRPSGEPLEEHGGGEGHS